MVYLNNAATSYPKPAAVREAVARAMSELPPGQFRGAIQDSGDIFGLCRKNLGALMGIADTDRIFFTSGATQSLNALLSGLQIPASRIITTVTEHNSVLRPLYNLPGIAGAPILLPCDERGIVSVELLEKELSDERLHNSQARAVILNHCSNVTGTIQDVATFCELAHRHDMLLILDCAQSAGCIPVDADGWGVDALAFTGHKSLMGLSGTGGYYVRRGLSLRPMLYGGTGRDSAKLRYTEEPETGDGYEYEVGTQNSVGIAALAASTAFISDMGIKCIMDMERSLLDRAIGSLSDIPGIRLYTAGDAAQGPLFSLTLEGLAPADLSYILQNSYGIVTRSGLHCAPLIHEYIGSAPSGTVRVSFSYMNTEEDVRALADAVREVAESL